MSLIIDTKLFRENELSTFFLKKALLTAVVATLVVWVFVPTASANGKGDVVGAVKPSWGSPPPPPPPTTPPPPPPPPTPPAPPAPPTQQQGQTTTVGVATGVNVGPVTSSANTGPVASTSTATGGGGGHGGIGQGGAAAVGNVAATSGDSAASADNALHVKVEGDKNIYSSKAYTLPSHVPGSQTAMLPGGQVAQKSIDGCEPLVRKFVVPRTIKVPSGFMGWGSEEKTVFDEDITDRDEKGQLLGDYNGYIKLKVDAQRIHLRGNRILVSQALTSQSQGSSAGVGGNAGGGGGFSGGLNSVSGGQELVAKITLFPCNTFEEKSLPPPPPPLVVSQFVCSKSGRVVGDPKDCLPPPKPPKSDKKPPCETVTTKTTVCRDPKTGKVLKK